MAKLFTHVGQAPNSRDCGFFCGYVVSLHKAHGGNLLQMRLSRQDVYVFRDAFLRSTQKPRVPGHRWLLPDQMPSFHAHELAGMWLERHRIRNIVA